MILKIILYCSWALNLSQFCFGNADIPFFDDSPICPDRFEDRDEVPYFEFETPSLPFEKRTGTIFKPDMSIQLPYLRPFSGTNDQDIQYMAGMDSSDSEFNSHLHLRKRSLSGDEESSKSSRNDDEQYEARFLSPLRRESRSKDMKTIHLPSSFTPRLGRKRSGEVEDPSDQDSYKTKGFIGRARVIDLKAGNAFTPRLGRSEETNKIHLFAGNAFTPRLGRSEGSNRIHFNAGTAFTPRLGRSEESKLIHLNGGSTFSSRFRKSENPNRVLLNAGSAFTPRLGRSESGNRILLSAGSAFTPRLGRSEGNRIINAGTSFTPRLGRSEGNRIFNAGSSFTPRLGRSEGNRIFNAGSSFTPRLGRSEDHSRIQLNAGSAFTPRLG